MPMTCTICRHSDRNVIERSLILGDSLRDIALRHKTSKDAVQRHRRCFSEMYERVTLAADAGRVLNLRTELNDAIADVKRVQRAARDMLEDPRQPGNLNLSRRSALDAAKLLLQASDRLDKHLRMLGDITGAFKQPQTNPREVDSRRYNEFVAIFMDMWQVINPKVERRQVVEAMGRMPETAGEFMPFVEAEIAGFDYRN
jgi:hypothetical protein